VKDENGQSTECDGKSTVERLAEKLLDSEDDNEILDSQTREWIDSLEVLSKIEVAFGTEELHAKTILDVGTDCVKPIYIALKFKPDKIIGISEDLPDMASDLEKNSRLFIKETKVRFHDCSFFDKEALRNILSEEKIDQFDFILLSKTLHHLRTGECIAKERNDKHEHQKNETEKCCIYGFEEQKIFEELLELGKRVIVSEWIIPQEKDDDKVRGRGGYFTANEMRRIFENLSGKYKIEFIFPERFHLNKEELNKVEPMLRRIDYICFYLERLA
jgi:hypothetical protein